VLGSRQIKKWWNKFSRAGADSGPEGNKFVFTGGGGTRLADYSTGFKGEITDIRVDSAHRRRQLMLLGALPGNRVSLEQSSPAYVVNIEDMRFALDRELASRIYVQPG